MPITLQEITRVPNGAHFRTADLHIHSFGASACVQDAAMTPEAIIDAAVQHHVSILAITDHNTDVNISRALSYAGRYAGQLLLLPGTELSTAHGHLLVYFAPDKASKVRDLLAQIDIQGDHGSRDSHTSFSMAQVIAKAELLGGICVAAHIDRGQSGFEAQPGYPSWKKDILTQAGLYGIEVDESSHLCWYSFDDEPTAAGAERKKLCTAREKGAGTAGRPRLAAIQGSDAHKMQDFVKSCQDRLLTRLKMDELSFEGFRTALIDPDARVRATAILPRSFPRVLGMQISGGFLDSSTFHLSDNLNCFIGGRGTGKSTAVKSLAYGLGINSDFADHDNCPDNIVVYAEDADGIIYRYERLRGQEPAVQAKEDRSITDVPPDAFRVEYYGQGDLAEVAKDPLVNPAKLQEFLDRHIVLSDLRVKESALLEQLETNSSQLIPVQTSAAQLPARQTALAEVNKKLQIAEVGKLKEVASDQTRLAAEKSFAVALQDVQQVYATGLSLANFLRDYDQLASAAGQFTGDARIAPLLLQLKSEVEAANTFLGKQEQTTNARLQEISEKIKATLDGMRATHKVMEQDLTNKVSEFQKKGLSGDLRGLNELIRQKTAITTEITRILGQQSQLKTLNTRREELLRNLNDVRRQIAERRNAQLLLINKNLHQTIEDYAINIYYDNEGITDDFHTFISGIMSGTYFPQDKCRNLCSRVSPSELLDLVLKVDIGGLGAKCGLESNWATLLIEKLATFSHIHRLQTMSKPGKPVIKVLTRTTPPKRLDITQLSDGQKHTILLTIAMLAESSLPLLIDQPEDDLDNAFIFKSIVATLRSIKERRQVIVVTHNANIAVLGDSELIFPMRRSDGIGRAFDAGSIDKSETAAAVQYILEGGELAFRRRQEVYGH